MTTEIHNHSLPAAPQPDAGGAEIIPFRRPSAPDSGPPLAPDTDDHQPDDDGPSAA